MSTEQQQNEPQTETADANTDHQKKVKKSVGKLVLTVFAMFAFGFALVPLYDVFCDITGLNGKTASTAAEVNDNGIDTSRTIKVQFLSRTAQGAPWKFEPEMNFIEVHPGEMKFVKFYAKNQSGRYAVAQAVPSVSPGQAANYFQKIECFCFNQQPLEADNDVWMPLQFYVDVDLPDHIEELTLSYTLYDITDNS